MPSEDDPRRAEVRAWIGANPEPTADELARSGYVVPHWPRPWGLDAEPMTQLIIDDELRRAGIKRPSNQIAVGWAGPTIIHAGTPEQKERYLWPIVRGEEQWCQLFSEPDAGSDLAGLGCRAVRDGDGYTVNGQKIWTTVAHKSAFGILIARTDPDAPKHRGISYFICPMDLPGIEIRPIADMTGQHSFNEVFFDDVRIPAENLVGEENRGWGLAKVTLGNERVSLSGEGALWGQGPSGHDLVRMMTAAGGTADPHLRQRLASIYIEAEILRLIRLRTLTARLRGEAPGPEASIRKGMADDHGQAVMELAKDLAGASGMVTDAGPDGSYRRTAVGGTDDEWHYGYLYSRALTIGGGTSEVQRNIVAEKVLGLPRDPDAEASRTWSEVRGLTESAGKPAS